MDTIVLTGESIGTAAEVLRGGGIAAVPTETVYGLSAVGSDPAAVEKIYEVKGRPETKPINLLVSGMTDVERVCIDIPEDAYKLAEAFWPGPLTIILKKRVCVPDIVTAGGSTVGVRCPDHPVTLELIKLVGMPLATPSANPSGMPSPKSFIKVMEYFDGLIECAVDGGDCAVGVESTIITLAEEPKILRQGGLPREEIERVLNKKVL